MTKVHPYNGITWQAFESVFLTTVGKAEGSNWCDRDTAKLVLTQFSRESNMVPQTGVNFDEAFVYEN